MQNDVKLMPYLNFMGEAGAAMDFYHTIFGGELNKQTFAEANMPVPDEEKNHLIHAELKTPNFSFYATDGNAEHPVTQGNSIHMSLVGSNKEELTKWFNQLSEGGKIDMPLAEQFWGDTYGQITDKFGIHWMINIYKKKE